MVLSGLQCLVYGLLEIFKCQNCLGALPLLVGFVLLCSCSFKHASRQHFANTLLSVYCRLVKIVERVDAARANIYVFSLKAQLRELPLTNLACVHFSWRQTSTITA